jgi:ethanolamine ammonia-lyase small subunit
MVLQGDQRQGRLPVLAEEELERVESNNTVCGYITGRESLGAELVVVLIGERPGLSAPDSMSAYLTWQPKVGRTDVERNCISNIRLEGLTYAESAQKLAWLIRQAKALGKTGVELKEESDS